MAMTAPSRARAGILLFALAIFAAGALLPAPTVAPETATARGAAAADRGDFAEALRWYRIAAEKGSAEAQFEIGVLYDTGQGVTQDPAEALRWYQRAADQGFAPAQVNIGASYEAGEGVPQDYGEAMRWLRNAADQGYALGQR